MELPSIVSAVVVAAEGPIGASISEVELARLPSRLRQTLNPTVRPV
jgi:hypothetical protein